MRTALPYLAGGVELALALAGAVLLWRIALSPAARSRPAASPLAAWETPMSDFLTYLLFVVGSSLVAAVAAGRIAHYVPLRGDEVTVFTGAAAQLGMLAGIGGYRALVERAALVAPKFGAGAPAAGAVTFLVSLPILIATAKVWEYLLQLCGLPTEKQDLIGMFANAKSPLMLFVMITLAVIIAPLTEELVFRAGLFRYFRTRLPRWAALLLPAFFFAALHVNWTTLQGLSSFAPLVVLAMIFSLAYERTGRIGTAIVAHGLFNLNTVLLIFSGVGV
ncbi:MAG: CPBP family intramembrane metalloprotease [Opitutus sp.]|nr:CPBP family intramembrane metalloprotease [Opitutus sp.]